MYATSRPPSRETRCGMTTPKEESLSYLLEQLWSSWTLARSNWWTTRMRNTGYPQRMPTRSRLCTPRVWRVWRTWWVTSCGSHVMSCGSHVISCGVVWHHAACVRLALPLRTIVTAKEERAWGRCLEVCMVHDVGNFKIWSSTSLLQYRTSSAPIISKNKSSKGL